MVGAGLVGLRSAALQGTLGGDLDDLAEIDDVGAIQLKIRN